MRLSIEKLGKVAITIEEDYWSQEKDYDRLTIVEAPNNEYKTYISRKPVPAGTVLTNRKYWIPFSSLTEEIVIDFNAFVTSLTEAMQETKQYADTVIFEGIQDINAIKQEAISIITYIADNGIDSSVLAPNSITNEKIQDGAVTNSKIANNSINVNKLSDGTIDGSKLKENSIPGSKLEDDAITSDKIISNAVTNDKIANGAITGDKLVDNTITGDKITDNTIPGSKIKDGTIENVDIKDNTLSGAKLVDNSISGSKIADNAITSSHLQDNSIPASKIKDGTIESIDIKDGTLDGSKIKDNTITGTKLADGAVTEAKLANGAITPDKIADNTITELQTIMDTVPTSGSSKPVMSGGVYEAIRSGVAKVGYYECDSLGNSADKAISADNYVLSTGGSMKVKMTNANTADNATLNINSTGAKPLFYDGERASANNSWEAGETVEVYYDGTNFYASNAEGVSHQVINEINTKIEALSSGLKVSLTVSPSVIYKGSDQSVTLTGTMTNGTPTSMKLMDGNTQLKETTASPIIHQLTANILTNTKSYQVIGETVGLTVNASASLNARYPIYYGFGSDASSVATNANQYPATTSAAHTYEKTSSANAVSFFILVPNDIADVSNFAMNYAPFVMDAVSTQTINGISYKVHKSSNTYNSGTTIKVIAS